MILKMIKSFWWQPCHQQSSGSVVLDDHDGFSSAHDSDPTNIITSVSQPENPNLHYLHFFRQKTGRFSPESRLLFFLQLGGEKGHHEVMIMSLVAGFSQTIAKSLGGQKLHVFRAVVKLVQSG